MTFTFPWQSVTQFVTLGHALASHPRSRAVFNIHRGHDEFKEAKNSTLCTNFTFLCVGVVKNEQETDSQGLSGQNQDDKLHR